MGCQNGHVGWVGVPCLSLRFEGAGDRAGLDGVGCDEGCSVDLQLSQDVYLSVVFDSVDARGPFDQGNDRDLRVSDGVELVIETGCGVGWLHMQRWRERWQDVGCRCRRVAVAVA